MSDPAERRPGAGATAAAATPRETLVDTLVRTISEGIIDGRFGPGVRLDEQTLAERFAVSRTPVREALSQLAASGLVEKRPHRGVVVATLTLERLLNTFEVMTELEATCARFAADRMTFTERDELVAIHRRGAAEAKVDDIDAYADSNRAFHLAIYAGAHNPILVDTTLDIRRRLAPFRHAQFRVEGRLVLSHAEHAAVVRAILDRDGEAAYRAMRQHIHNVQDAYRSYAGLGRGEGDGGGDPSAGSASAPPL